MDNQQGKLIWNEGDADSFPSLFALMVREYGGWKVEKMVDYFIDFTRLILSLIS